MLSVWASAVMLANCKQGAPEHNLSPGYTPYVSYVALLFLIFTGYTGTLNFILSVALFIAPDASPPYIKIFPDHFLHSCISDV